MGAGDRVFVLQAIFHNQHLHLWAVRQQVFRDAGTPPVEFAAHEEIERLIATLWGNAPLPPMTSSSLRLRLPQQSGESRRIDGTSDVDGRNPSPSPPPLSPEGRGVHNHDPEATCEAPALALAPADAIDLLTSLPAAGLEDISRVGDSVRFWARLSRLVLELLARQSFVPAIHLGSREWARGYWRVVISDEHTSRRLGDLISAMPGVCRCIDVPDPDAQQASALVEEFLWHSVDQVVRRCLKGDELAEAIQSAEHRRLTPQMRWLQALVGPDAAVHAAPEEREFIHARVRPWLAKLEPAAAARPFRTCFRLEPPDDPGLDDGARPSWRLTLHVQSLADPEIVLEADQLLSGGGGTPSILPRPFEGALPELREDVARAARRFPPLLVCAAPDAPLECPLTMAEAHQFLREAARLLEADGFGVWLPAWWKPEAPRLRMQLNLRPTTSETSGVMRLDSIVEFNWRVALGDESLDEDELVRLAAEKQPLVRLQGRWTEVRPEDVFRALDFVRKHKSGTTTLFDALRKCYLADDVETGLPVTGIHAEGWIDKLLNASEGHVRISDVTPPESFRGTLRPYQVRGLQWLRFLSQIGLGGCLADDMGLGKTIQLIALLLLEKEALAGTYGTAEFTSKAVPGLGHGDAESADTMTRRGGNTEYIPASPRPRVPASAHPYPGAQLGPTLLIVPMSLVGNWKRELERFAPAMKVLVHHGLERPTGNEFLREAPKYDVVISTYSLAHRDFEYLSKIRWRRIALDEAQNIKNPGAKQSQAIRGMPASHRLALTGTPVENHLTELWAIMDFLNEGYLGSVGDFRQRFAIPIERHRDDDRAKRLRQLIRPFVLRRMKSDPAVEVDLPPKMEMIVYCNLTKEQAILYEAVVNEMMGQIDRAAGMQRRGLVLATLIKLKQVCNHPVQFLREGGELDQRSGKCERLSEMLDEVISEGDRALVFTQYREMGELLKRMLEKRFGETVFFLHGGTTRGDREKMVDQFQDRNGGPKLFVLSLKAGGFGLNLTAANHVFHFDRWWNPAVEDQATDRAHRIGQVRRVQVHKFVCVGTLEERINAMLEEKRNLADNIIGGGETWITELSTEALRDLFSLSRDAVADE